LIKSQNSRQNNNLVRLDHFSSEQPAGESSGSNMTRHGGKQDPKTHLSAGGRSFGAAASRRRTSAIADVRIYKADLG
jgi:hypothetical protein